MRISFVLTLLPALALSVLASPTLVDDATATLCPGGTVLSTSFIGENKDVQVNQLYCPADKQPRVARDLKVRQANVCGATCNTNCFLPAGGGPDPNECHIIADALRFESENTGALFQIGTGSNNTITMQFRSCLSFFRNQDFVSLTYCRLDWADVIDFVAPNCQATQNAHGGNCVASDQRWFIQVQHS
ncbi:hypothetical protein PLEOSDRAFT_1090748 [Pleurotus ostreatus PC15]|uniref:Uncharacterized protein n=1 Tax=Pleurotus ostreatus (strain PC15) TaxID=1137138 RepID=A0A067N561_PLEO1|nr:hypothetical protein PLEOSDRAFT_1090748 [Pleurotus ostreatus PC15]